MSPLFSITIPAFKAAFLREAITSVCQQSYENWELIVLDDAFPEDIKSVVCGFNDSRIKYLCNEKNTGALNVVDNWNKCLGLCQGEYVICMGDDDMLLSCALEEYVKLMQEYPGLNVYHGLTDVVNERGQIIGHQRIRPKYQTAEELILHRWQGDIQFIGDFCYRTEHLRRQGGYYKLPLAWASDDITAVRAAEDGGIANTQVPCFLYRENGLTISSSRNNGVKLDAKACEKQWYVGFFKRHPGVSRELFPVAFDDWFRGQIGLHLQQYFEESLWNLFDALRKGRALDVDKRSIITKWLKVAAKSLKVRR